jgi:hypothetical protein
MLHDQQEADVKLDDGGGQRLSPQDLSMDNAYAHSQHSILNFPAQIRLHFFQSFLPCGNFCLYCLAQLFDFCIETLRLILRRRAGEGTKRIFWLCCRCFLACNNQLAYVVPQ